MVVSTVLCQREQVLYEVRCYLTEAMMRGQGLEALKPSATARTEAL